MGFEGGRLAPLFELEPSKRAVRKMADTGGDSLHDYAVRNTPIDTGNLRSSWYRTRTKKRPTPVGEAFESEVKTDVNYAPYVENGTGLYGPTHAKYLIEPKNAKSLSWMGPGGSRVFASHVWHPGSPGQHMMASATAKVEALYEDIQKGNLRQWVRETEALEAKAMSGVR